MIRMSARSATVLTATVAAVFLVTGCSSGGSGPVEPVGAGDPSSPERTELKTSIFQGSIDTALFEANTFAQEDSGLTIGIEWMTDAAAARSQLASGSLDAIPTAPTTTYDMITGGIDVRIVAGAHFQTDGTVTLEAIDDSIDGPGDLDGLTVGTVGLTGLYVNRVKIAIDEDGGDHTTVEFVQIPYGEMGAALQQGIIDAAVTQGLAQFQSRQVGSHEIYDIGGGDRSSRMENVWLMTTDFIAENPNTVAAFQCALEKGAVKGQDRDVVEAFLADELGWTAEVVAAAPSVTFATGTVDTASLQADFDDRVTLGEIPEDTDFDWADFIVPLPDNCG